MTDTEMLDWLEAFINEHGGLVLHDGHADFGKYSGLGLRPGYLDRTLREAIQQCANGDKKDNQKHRK